MILDEFERGFDDFSPEELGPGAYGIDPYPVLTSDIQYNYGELARYMRKNNKTYFDLTQEEIDMFIIKDADKN